MSRFKELCQVYNSSYNEMYDYLENCVQFVENLIAGMVDFLECPEKRIQYKDKLGEDKSLREAMYLKDGSWRFDVAITICRENSYRRRAATFSRCYYPRQTIVLPFIMKNLNTDSFIIGLDEQPRYFTLHRNDKNSFIYFYEFIFEEIKVYYEKIFQIILDKGESPTNLELSYLKEDLKVRQDNETISNNFYGK